MNNKISWKNVVHSAVSSHNDDRGWEATTTMMNATQVLLYAYIRQLVRK